jgi:hypothetical protein
MTAQHMRINVDELANFIFIKNSENKEIYLNIQSLKTTKELFFFLFDIFCKGIVLLFGKNNKMKLNNLEPDQFDKIKEKLKYAHINLIMTTYDEDTAKLLDLVPEDVKEKNVIQESIKEILNMEDNNDLISYMFKLYMNDTLFCINFEIIR